MSSDKRPASGRFVRPLGKPGAPLVIPASDVEVHEITCPYCIWGKARIEVMRDAKNREVQVDLNQHPLCSDCGRPMRIKPRVILVGAPLEDHLQTPAERDPNLKPESR